MSAVRRAFLKAIRSISDSAQDAIVETLAPSERKHNNRAQVIRNGLAVVTFACLEHFLKSRMSELFRSIGSAGLSFDDLPDRMQEAATVDAINAIRVQSDLVRRQGGDQVDYIRQMSTPFAAYGSPPYSLVALSLGHTKSNLNQADVKDMLKVFDIKDGWGQISLVAGRVGSSILAPDSLFQQAAARRHSAAHNPSASCPTVDLRNFIGHSKILAATFDLLISHAAYQMMSTTTWMGPLDNSCVRLRFLDKVGNNWEESVEGNPTIVASTSKIASIEKDAEGRARALGESLVVRGPGLRLVRWNACC